MGENQRNVLQKQERARDRSRKADSFWKAFSLTENGKVKSTLMLNSFCLCLLFLAVYVAAFALLLDVIHPLVESLPVAVINLVEALVPAIAGTAVCLMTWFLFKEKRMPALAFLWLAFLALACFAAMLVILRGDAAARGFFLQFFALFVPAPILLGGGMSGLLYHRYMKRRAVPALAAESWKRQ